MKMWKVEIVYKNKTYELVALSICSLPVPLCNIVYKTK